MRIQVVDPSAYTPPYDRSLCAALARAGADVELVTSRFAYGPVAEPEGYRVTELFYRRGIGRPGSRARLASKLAQHPIDMHRLAHGQGTAIPDPDVRHFQWLTVQHLDRALLRRTPGPLVLTAHDVLPREPRRGQLRAQRRLYDAVDAVVVHSRHGRARLVDELGVEAEKVSVIPHGAFDYLTRIPDQRPLDPAIERFAGDRPLAMLFGLMRPYKGIDLLLRAWRAVSDPEARLLIAGMPRMPVEPLLELADERVMIVPRFIGDDEIPALFRRAELVVLPYREIDQSGVLYTALAFGKACLLAAAGGFTEVADDHGAARVFPPGDEAALAAELSALLRSDDDRRILSEAALAAASGPYSWDSVAESTLELYRSLAHAPAAT